MASKKLLRIASLSPSATQTLRDLGLEERICAWTDDALVGPGMQGTILGHSQSPDYKLTTDLSANLYVVESGRTPADLIEAVRGRGKVIDIFAPSLLDVHLKLQELGEVVDRADEAQSVCLAIQAEELSIQSEVVDTRTLEVFVPITPDPWKTISGASYAGGLLAACGARNVFQEAAVPMPEVVPESLEHYDFDAVLLPAPTFTTEDKELMEVDPALSRKPLRLINERAIFWSGTYTIEGLKTLHESLQSIRRKLG